MAEPPVRTGSDYEILDARFKRYLVHSVRMQKLGEGFRWTEGPVWIADADCLLFSDIPNNCIMRWIEGVGMSVYRQPSRYSNGHTRDRDGRLISCLHGQRAVVRTEHDGSITVLADRFEGKRLNSPNDVVVKSDGSIWFTDPHYGIIMDYEGEGRADEELPTSVYRIDPHTGALRLVSDAFGGPNGLCFSPDESRLYIADTGRMHEDHWAREIRVFDVLDSDAGRLSEPRFFYKPDVGVADGFRADEQGNIWTSAGDGVHCVTPEGEPIGKLRVPQTVSNVTFGGRARSRLFICATHEVYAIYLNIRGAVPL
ncbi:SMP-30/gluconolactonase/LRE family protein [Lichenicoccus roseus]|uniref:SMP-30/gluconolactonase/LRE family protein n=1 Tax=Lichenicoccus roseus TaxID=2683649 RepID=A0A5R9J982_9PROT|nr:SMP-30/gluconolactonase/LRE family protein [Lichenicoccus roseus]TLU74132.1 SMP-30/gluconolactonase/LRE family protein [Lichenicoccus roseus]